MDFAHARDCVPRLNFIEKEQLSMSNQPVPYRVRCMFLPSKDMMVFGEDFANNPEYQEGSADFTCNCTFKGHGPVLDGQVGDGRQVAIHGDDGAIAECECDGGDQWLLKTAEQRNRVPDSLAKQHGGCRRDSHADKRIRGHGGRQP